MADHDGVDDAHEHPADLREDERESEVEHGTDFAADGHGEWWSRIKGSNGRGAVRGESVVLSSIRYIFAQPRFETAPFVPLLLEKGARIPSFSAIPAFQNEDKRSISLVLVLFHWR